MTLKNKTPLTPSVAKGVIYSFSRNSSSNHSFNTVMSTILKDTPQKSKVYTPAPRLYKIKEACFVDKNIIVSNYPLSELNDVYNLVCDAEWSNTRFDDGKGGGSMPGFLSKQFKVISGGGYKAIIYMVDRSVPMPDILSAEIRLHFPRLIVIYGDIQDLTFIPYMALLKMQWRPKTEIRFTFFSSFSDVVCLIGRNAITEQLLRDGLIIHKRNTGGVIPERVGIPGLDDMPAIKLFDLVGGFNSTLEQSFAMVGLDCHAKTLPNEWAKKLCPSGTSKQDLRSYAMGHMKEFMTEEPENSMLYGLGDINLDTLWSKRVSQLNAVVNESLGFNPELTPRDCPRSSGALVSLIFQKWFALNYPALAIAVNVLCVPSREMMGEFRAFREELVNWAIGDFEPGVKWVYAIPGEVGSNVKHKMKKIDVEHPNKNFQKFDSEEGSIAGISGASIRAFGERTNTSACFNGVVQGGRCVNERPEVFEHHEVFDIDLNSCYGSALTDFTFPVGLPTVWSVARDSKPTTLGEWLQEYESELSDNNWQILVETVEGKPLSFAQDLIYSKLHVTKDSIRKNLAPTEVGESEDDHSEPWVRDVAAAHIKGDFALLLNEIKLGVITSDNLKVMKAVASNKELKELMGLVVVTAAYYPNSQQVTPEQLVDEFCRKPGEMVSQDGELVDGRTRKWAAIPMSGFIGRFVTARKRIKKMMVRKGDIFDLKQNSLKLFINTTYGCFASPYFAMGNAILANNITAKARTGVWMLVKALGCAQSITDGGLYSNKAVRFLDLSKVNKKKPGFNVFANPEDLDSHRNITVGKLTDHAEFVSRYHELKTAVIYVDGVAVDEAAVKAQASWNDDLDTLATRHINNFWRPYGLELPFQIEHKHTNTCDSAITWGSSDYLFNNPIEPDKTCLHGLSYVVKARGAKESNHPKKAWLLLLSGQIDFTVYEAVARDFESEERIGINQWKHAQNTKGRLSGLLPADTLFSSSNHKPNLNHSKTTTVWEFEERKRRHTRACTVFDKLAIDTQFRELFGIAETARNQRKLRACVKSTAKILGGKRQPTAKVKPPT